MRGKPATEGTVYAWLLGQDDNVGDTVLRREYANVLRQRGPVVAHVGDASDSYISGLGLKAGEHVHRRFLPWVRELRRASKEGPVTVAINSGEFALSRLYALMALPLLPTLRTVHRRGGKVVWLGAAVPYKGRWWLDWVFTDLFANVDLVKWRDNASAQVFEVAPWMPDWAFAAVPGGQDRERTTLGVSLRFDRPYPSAEWLTAVRDLSQRLGLDVVAVAQVQRDSDCARQLAADLGGRAVVFDGGSHVEQERIVRDEYRSMQVMLSDRLHGLIMSATEGVVPLAWCEAATEKIDRHLSPVGLGFATVPPGELLTSMSGLDRATVATLAETTRSSISAASAELSLVRSEVATL
ncbi:polysaccharide pyruvyl transferase family protein [Herbiconiux flava]|nr:polysaccharide pyruvyl transferase family protein [Herbiconiux flava]